MSRCSRKTARIHNSWGWLVAGVLFASVGLASGGCTAPALRGDSFPRDETFQWPGRVRPPDPGIEAFGFSNKARQIEQDFGVQ